MGYRPEDGHQACEWHTHDGRVGTPRKASTRECRTCHNTERRLKWQTAKSRFYMSVLPVTSYMEDNSMFRRPLVVRRRGAPLLATAAVGGVAYMAGKNIANNTTRESSQEARLADIDQQQNTMAQPAPLYTPPTQPQAATSSPDRLAQLKRLGELREAGVLSDTEFESEKQKILQGY